MIAALRDTDAQQPSAAFASRAVDAAGLRSRVSNVVTAPASLGATFVGSLAHDTHLPAAPQDFTAAREPSRSPSFSYAVPASVTSPSGVLSTSTKSTEMPSGALATAVLSPSQTESESKQFAVAVSSSKPVRTSDAFDPEATEAFLNPNAVKAVGDRDSKRSASPTSAGSSAGRRQGAPRGSATQATDDNPARSDAEGIDAGPFKARRIRRRRGCAALSGAVTQMPKEVQGS